jgi:DnaJ like chaperone protein
MFERTDPKTLLKWLVVAALVYLLMPYDLLPDFLGLPGRIDDIVVIAYLAWFYRVHARRFIASSFGQDATGGSSNAHSGQHSPAGAEKAKAFDAYAVLGVSRSASSDAIQAAYRARMMEYHPDKVAHLGEELQKLAHDKSQDIQRAYRELRR